MVHTIAPVVYGQGPSQHFARRRWLPAIALHAIGAVGSGMLLGGLLGALGAAVPLGPTRSTWGAVLLGLLCVLYALHELRVLDLPYPQWQRQVQAQWRSRFHPYVTALLFGVQLGVGYATFVSVATLYVVTVAAVVAGSPSYGALLFGLFAFGRAGLLVPLAWHVRTHRDGVRISSVMIATKPLVHLGNGWALALASGWLLAASVHAWV